MRTVPKLPHLRVAIVNAWFALFGKPVSRKLLTSVLTSVAVYAGTLALARFGFNVHSEAIKAGVPFGASQVAGFAAGWLARELPQVVSDGPPVPVAAEAPGPVVPASAPAVPAAETVAQPVPPAGEPQDAPAPEEAELRAEVAPARPGPVDPSADAPPSVLPVTHNPPYTSPPGIQA